MQLPDGTSLEVTGLENEKGHVTGRMVLIMPDHSTLEAWVDFTPKMEVTSGAISHVKSADGAPK